MKIYTAADIDRLEKYFRIKLINGITGFKSANLIGSRSTSGIENLAVFSSVVHVGSNPPYIGFITRPTTVIRNTYENIMDNGYYTINSISIDQAPRAHKTSAKFPRETSEFSECNFESYYHEDFQSPFVKNAAIGIGCKFVEEIEIKSNATRMIIGSIEVLLLQDIDLSADGYPNLSEANIATISSLDGYHPVGDPRRFEYARPNQAIKEIQ